MSERTWGTELSEPTGGRQSAQLLQESTVQERADVPTPWARNSTFNNIYNITAQEKKSFLTSTDKCSHKVGYYRVVKINYSYVY